MHIKDSPSAFIPFCEFNGDMLVMGEKIEEFAYPVCNKFKPKILKGQLCYQVDVNEFKNKIVAETNTVPQLIFLLDYNEEKMLTANVEPKNDVPKDMLEMQNIDNKKIEALIYIETLGRCITKQLTNNNLVLSNTFYFLKSLPLLTVIASYRAPHAIWGRILCSKFCKRNRCYGLFSRTG